MTSETTTSRKTVDVQSPAAESKGPGHSGDTIYTPNASQADRERATLRRGDSLGRFVVLDRLGEGGMGVVVAAYDPQLDRRVAIKLLHPRTDEPSAAGEARVRLLREAQAMARLRHPNVVTVYEVDAFSDGVFVAMEYVAGGTLTEWLERARARKAPWQAIVRAFVQAGRGLAAAHRAGLVHRDFKPDNVLIEGDRVQVTDFGIASVAGPAEEPQASKRGPPGPLTQTGTVLGTPHYMAPEQFRGADVDARADQFAFCVALFEALAGRRPFAGDTPEQLHHAAALDRPPALGVPGVPAFVGKVLERGLRGDPARRFASMDELLVPLGGFDDDAFGRRSRVFGLMAVLGAFVGVPLLWSVGWLPGTMYSYPGLLGLTALLFSLALFVGWWRRADLAASALNRRVWRSLLVIMCVAFMFLVGARALGIGSEHAVVLQLALFSGCVAMFAVNVERGLWPSAIGYAVGFAVAAAFPPWERLATSLGSTLVVVNAAWVWRRRPSDQSRDQPSAGLPGD